MIRKDSHVHQLRTMRRLLIIYFSVVALLLLFILKGYLFIDFLYEYGIIYHIFGGYQRIILPTFSSDSYDLNRNINSIRKNNNIPFIYLKLGYDLKQLINPGISS